MRIAVCVDEDYADFETILTTLILIGGTSAIIVAAWDLFGQ